MSPFVASYVNGELGNGMIGTYGDGIASYSSVLRLNDLFDSLLDSNIDDVKIYNRALTATEVFELYNGKVDDSSSYTKIANDGSELPSDATLGTNPKDWACTKNNKTGLIWEVKTDDSKDSSYPDSLRDEDHIYAWKDVTDFVTSVDGSDSIGNRQYDKPQFEMK